MVIIEVPPVDLNAEVTQVFHRELTHLAEVSASKSNSLALGPWGTGAKSTV